MTAEEFRAKNDARRAGRAQCPDARRRVAARRARRAVRGCFGSHDPSDFNELAYGTTGAKR